jgi:hypothetical protein
MERYFDVIREVAERRGLHSVLERTEPGLPATAGLASGWDTRALARKQDA